MTPDGWETGVGLIGTGGVLFGPMELRSALTWQRTFDAVSKGGPMPPDVNAYTWGLNLGLPIGEDLAFNAGVTWNKVEGVEASRSEWTTINAGYSKVFRDTGALHLMLKTDKTWKKLEHLGAEIEYNLEF
jgi:hypothetical protein